MMHTRDEFVSTCCLSSNNNLLTFIILSANNDPLGHCWLGVCYEKGRGVEKDVSKAIELYRRAIDQDSPLGFCYLAVCYEKGNGVEKDVSRAAELYRRASDQDYPLGHCQLGLCYENGEGVEKDVSRAAELYRRASDQDYARGHCSLGLCYENGEGVEKDVSRAVELYQRASDQDYYLGHLWLGACYENGDGVEKNIKQAVLLYKKAFKLKAEYFVHINRNLDNFSLEDLIEIKDMCISHARLDYMDIVQSYIDKHLKSAAYMKLCKTAIDVWEQTTCPVCLEELNDQDQLHLFMTKCLHLYHSGCVEHLEKCPMCRSELEEINC